jgi:hypothetical protein
MSIEPDSKAPGQTPRLIDTAAKARALAALRAGATRAQAAAAAGFPLKSLYGARRRDPVFSLAWAWAIELAAVDERGGALARGGARRGGGAAARIVPQVGRLLQRRRMRWVRFTEARQQIFLDHFAGTADAGAAADAAGVSYHTVRAHYRRNPEFAAAWHEALRLAYATLEAEAVRQRLEIQQRLQGSLAPTGEAALEFERVMKLLARWDRREGRIGPRERQPGGERRWTFDEAIATLDKRLRDLGVRRRLLPPDGEAPEPEPEPKPEPGG